VVTINYDRKEKKKKNQYPVRKEKNGDLKRKPANGNCCERHRVSITGKKEGAGPWTWWDGNKRNKRKNLGEGGAQKSQGKAQNARAFV